MWVYYLFFSIVIVACLASEKRKSVFVCATIALALWLLIGLRDSTVGSDTGGYLADFHLFAKMGFVEMWHSAISYREPLYVIISWLIAVVAVNDTFYLLVWALFPVISLFVVFRNYLIDGKEYLASILVFFILGLFAFYVAGIRQTAALSITLLSFKYIHEKKIFPFLLCIVVATMIHSSAVLFVVAYPLRYIKIRWWFAIIALALFILASRIQLDSVFVLSQYFFGQRFGNYAVEYESTQSATAFLIQLVLFVLCLFKAKPLIEKDSQNNVLFVLVFIGLVFQSLANMMAEMSRVSFYFCIFYLILVPRALTLFGKNRITAPIVLFFTASCLLYLFALSSSNLPEYQLASFLR
jgi:hypothetical protein